MTMEQHVGTSGTNGHNNKEIISAFQKEAFYGQNIDQLRHYFTDDFVDHFAPPDDPPGFEGIRKRFHQCSASFKFLKVDVPVWLSAGDTLFQIIVLHFQHTGEFLGIPATNKVFSIGGMDAFKLRGGLISEHWGVYDTMQIPGHLGVTLQPSPAERAPLTI